MWLASEFPSPSVVSLNLPLLSCPLSEPLSPSGRHPLHNREWAYEIPHKEVPVKQPKGHKRHRLEEERCAKDGRNPQHCFALQAANDKAAPPRRANKVQENLAKMDQKIEEYRVNIFAAPFVPISSS